MTNRRPPPIDVRFTDLSEDPLERHEALVGAFGQLVFWLRNWSLTATKELAKSDDARQKLGSIRRKKYDELAELTLEQQDIAIKISEATVDRFIQLFLTMLAGTGTDLRLGDDHAIRFKMDMEVVSVRSLEVVFQETINRGGRKFLADYWGRWLNKYGGY